MINKNINEAELEARRFLKRIAEYKTYRAEVEFDAHSHGRKFYEPWQDKRCSAIKRASMDLTRALAKMRNGR